MNNSTTPNPRILEFLNRCRNEKEAEHDNSSKIPPALKESFPDVKVSEVWRNYLECKFRFLIQLKNEPSENVRPATIALATALELPQGAELVESWQLMAADEERAFFYRIIQLPKETAKSTWYDVSIRSVGEWCDSLESQHQTLIDELRRDTVTRDQLESRAKEISSKFDFLPGTHILDDLTRRVIDEVTSKINEEKIGLSQALLKLSQGLSSPKLRSREETDLPHPFLNLHDFLYDELAIQLTKTFLDTGHDETSVIVEFLEQLRSMFDCDLCDYLEVSHGPEKDSLPYLELRAVTMNPNQVRPGSPVARGSVTPEEKKKETYYKWQGITGGILLLDAKSGHDLWRYHVGSDDVPNDPRTSESHLSLYEDQYAYILTPIEQDGKGKIKNFWTFPIYSKTQLIGIFRVVNKTREESGVRRIIDWTFEERVKLTVIAKWFSNFLDMLRQYVESREEMKVLLTRQGVEQKIVEHLGLDWIGKGLLKKLIGHLFMDVSKKVEKRTVGCCVIVAEEPRKVPNQRLYPLLYPKRDIAYPYGNVDPYHDAIDPLLGGFLIDKNGDFDSIVRFSANGDGSAHPKNVTKGYNRCISLFLGRGAKTIQVYQSDQTVANIFISEYSGEWVVRFNSEVKDAMKKCIPPDVPNDVLDQVAEVCLKLANSNSGAIFVFGPRRELDIALEHKLLKKDTKIDYVFPATIDRVGLDVLHELAKLDGATFIDYQGNILRTNFVILSKEPPQPATDDSTADVLQRGARHTAGVVASIICEESLVIVISENGGITLLQNGAVKAPDL